MRRLCPWPALSLAALAISFGLAGCMLVATSESRYRDGPLHQSETLEVIKPGTTTRAWVLERFGQPAGAYTNDAGNEVLRYVSVQERQTELLVFLLFAFDFAAYEAKTTHIEIEGGQVKSYWIE